MSAEPLTLDLTAFKARSAQLRESGEGARLTKAMGGGGVEAGADGRLTFTITDGSVDRENDVVDPTGCTNLATFVRDGVVLWAHDARLPPIAKPTRVWVEGNAIKAEAEFTPPDMPHPMGVGFGATIAEMYRSGFMRSVSIGFKPSEWSIAEDRGTFAYNFLRWELMEFSAVPVPANANAVVDLARKGLDLTGLRAWTERLLDGGVNLLVPRADLESVRAAIVDAQGKALVSVPALSKLASPPAEIPPAESTTDAKLLAVDKALEGAAAALARIEAQVAALGEKVAQIEQRKAAAPESPGETTEEMAARVIREEVAKARRRYVTGELA